MNATPDERHACHELANAFLNFLIAHEHGRQTRAAEQQPAPAPSPTAAITTEPAEELLLIAPREAAEILGVTDRTLFNLTVPHGSIPVVRVGHQKRYSPEDLKEWIEKQKQH